MTGTVRPVRMLNNVEVKVMKILIVQCQPEDRAYLAKTMTDHGHDVIEAADGVEALEAAAAHGPDLIISGALMLRMNGFQLIKQIKERTELAAIPFIFFAVPFTGRREIELAYTLGADAYIVKHRPLVDIWPEVEAILRTPRIARAEDETLKDVPIEESQLNGYSLEVVHELERKITALEKAKAEIEQSENLYRVMVENVGDVVWMMDMIFRFIYVSPASTRILQCSMAEALTMTVEELFTPASLKVMGKVLAEELAADEDFSKDLLRSRLVVLEMRRRDGMTFLGEVRITFLRDPEGRAIGMVGVTRDITDRESEMNRQPMISTLV